MKRNKIAIIILTLFILNIVFPAMSTSTNQNDKIIMTLEDSIKDYSERAQRSERDPYIYDSETKEQTASLFDGIQNDMGYNTDIGDRIFSAKNIFVGEPTDNSPGRTGTGQLNPNTADSGDWYRFTVCKGQQIQASLSSTQSYSYMLADTVGHEVGQSYTADVTGWYFIHVYAEEGAEEGTYQLSVTLTNQNDADTGSDAGNTLQAATSISPGTYDGYMDSQDTEDWYSFSVSSGQAITVTVSPLDKSDYDIHLYNPNGEYVYSAKKYGEDILSYPADQSGTWSIKLDIFPGWDESLWPENYYLYGSGVYELELNFDGEATVPVTPLPQPEITPISKTFIINDDPLSNKDEYAYLAAVPAANYLENGERFVAPIVYQGVDTITNWFGTVDDTTQYLLDDWHTYLDRHGQQAEEIVMASEPVDAAAAIALQEWEEANTVVLAVDGSSFSDEIQTLIDTDATLDPQTEVVSVAPAELRDIGGLLAKPMYIGNEWGAIAVHGLGESFSGDAGVITAKYESLMADWWPFPHDKDGPDTDVYFPISKKGIWMPYTTSIAGLDELKITKVAGDRYTIPVSSTDTSIKVTVSTQTESSLHVYLIDPEGNIRRPSMPSWNGGPVNPIHIWNGGHWDEIGTDEWRFWEPEPTTEHTAEIHYPMTGNWNVIIIPPSLETNVGPVDYAITGEIRTHGKRVDAGLSAANAAVLASMHHAPLLYVTEDAVPSATADAISSLSAANIIFVNIGETSSANPTGTVTEYTSMQEVIDAIKDESASENFITFTSFGSGDGYFAPSGMIAAYHGSPVLNIGEAAMAYDTIDKLVTWEEYAGDYYHGCRSIGHLPAMDHPFDFMEFIQGLFQGEFPHPGFDLKLRWYKATAESVADCVEGFGLNQAGKEAYMFVAPRDGDIRSHLIRAVSGNESYAGQIPVETSAFSTALICRNILYPALIFANEGRDHTTACIMNHWEGYEWVTNDGETHMNEVTLKIKEYFSSYNRFFEGHTLWENILACHNSGVSAAYHTSHGTGGSGICCMYENVAEQFPYAELRYEHLHDFDWWDSWRAYYYDNAVTGSPRDEGRVWFNSEEPNLYDFVHFKWCDQLFENLHSQVNLWQSCTTAHNFGPMIYLEHGAVLWYGNANTGRSPQTDFMDSWWFYDFFIEGKPIAEAQTDILWLFERDYTTCDPTSIYGVSSMDATVQIQGSEEGLVNTWVFFGDPTLQIYRPDWIEPEPV